MTAFNNRRERPTSWQTELHTGADFFERMYAGSVEIKGGFDVDEETDRMWDELERKKKEGK